MELGSKLLILLETLLAWALLIGLLVGIAWVVRRIHLAWETRAAKRGNPEQQAAMGMRYLEGIGVKQNPEKAIAWYRKAAEQGWREAQVNLGLLLLRGEGVEANPEEAKRWFLKVVERGQKANDLEPVRAAWAMATFNLGWMALMEQKFSEAANWFRQATERKCYLKEGALASAMAQCNLAWLYAEGRGVEQNPEEAAKRYRISAKAGYAEAQYQLGLLLAQGKGVPRDPEEAKVWFQKAALQEHPEALQQLRQQVGAE